MQKINTIKRRNFLSATSSALSTLHIIPSKIYSNQGKGPNDCITLAVIGTGGKGTRHLIDLLKMQHNGLVKVAAVCDIDDNRLSNAIKKSKADVTPYRDYRYILERKDIDGVVIATPDHWHAVQMVHAAESGKHIYVEKPACCTIEEGRAMIKAARDNKVAVQVGSQGRSQEEAYYIHRYLANRMIGQVNKVECFHPAGPVDETPVPDSTPPAELDWDMWLGPLRWRPYNARLCPGTFRWIMDSGGGQIRDRGAHVMSCILYWLGQDGTGPVTINATGTEPLSGLWNSSVDMEVKYTFKNPDWQLVWTNGYDKIIPIENRDNPPKKFRRLNFGTRFSGSKGEMTFWGGDGRVMAESKVLNWAPSNAHKDVFKSPGHMEDWFNSIRTNSKTIMNIEAGVNVANLCILGNISFILGRKIKWDQAKQEIIGDDQARRMMDSPQRHPYHL